ncbi:hypothetical protein KFU94_64340 [Chloroflexi bacterium TSY]|nr:hypothetical protein [Chloroflexi bacterium TSY]
MTTDKMNTSEVSVNEPAEGSEVYQLQTTITTLDDKGAPMEFQASASYPRGADQKPFMGATHEQHSHQAGGLTFASDYEGISPEQEYAIQRIVVDPNGGEEQVRGNGPSPSDIVTGRSVKPNAGEETASNEFAQKPDALDPGDSPSIAVPTGISDAIQELPERIGEQIRQQVQDIEGFTVTLTKQDDGSLTVDSDIKRTLGAVPQSAGDNGSNQEVIQVSEDTINEHNDDTNHAVSKTTNPTVIRLGTSTEVAQPTQEDADTISANVSSAASASTRNSGLIVTKIATVDGVSLSVNVNLFTLILDA